MPKKFNILFTSAGRRVALIQNFKQSLGALGLSGEIVAADKKIDAPAFYEADYTERVPPVSDPQYITRLLEICAKYSVNLLIPLIDTELLLLSEKKNVFEKIGTRVLVSSPETVRISTDKRMTANFFQKLGVASPKIMNHRIDKMPFPCLIKPADGSCSIGVTKIHTIEELHFFRKYIKNALIQEYISGEEYTLDILIDFAGNVRCVVPRLRLETRAGEVSKGVTVKNPALIAAGKKVAEGLPGAIGCITVQCFLTDENEIVFIEINPRFGGGFPLAKKAGADFPRWIIEMALNRKPVIPIDGWQDGLLMLRYDDAFFIAKGERQ